MMSDVAHLSSGGSMSRQRPRRQVPVDRRHVILERVADEQTIHVGDLARELQVSEMTIRRDIRRLERDGFLRQTYGGATAHLTRSLDVAFNARALQHSREKRLIAMRAAGLVDRARTVFLGVGTTVEQFARYLRARPELTVVTASLPTASLLGTRTVQTIAVGGTVVRDDLTATGPIAVATIERYRFDVAVGVSARWGITELSDEEAEVQRAAIRRAETVVVLADGSKLGVELNAVVGPIDVITTLVTDASAPADELAALGRRGVDILVADASDGLETALDAPRASGRARAARS
jgi:DeoR family transcriptional regulator of aga operon/DeoR family fructose operon transcriptional repressor